MKKIYSATIRDHAMTELTEADYSEGWSSVAAYIINALDDPDAYEILEGAEHIPGDIEQDFGGLDPEDVCVLSKAGEPVEVWFAAHDTWYACLTGPDDTDWGTGSYELNEAKIWVRARRDVYPDAYVAVIQMGRDPVCVDEIRDF